jgi:aryl-alcohol dehydrogenase-like predicted oxidoreductase
MKDRTTSLPAQRAPSEIPPVRPGRGPGREATRATSAGTRRLAERDDGDRSDFRRAFPRRLTVSALGAGTYLGDCTDADDLGYAQTLHAAVADGVNLIDTASNYRCQRSERVVGRTLESLIAAGEVRRDEVVICTKGGYVALDGVPPASREAYDEWLDETLVGPGIVNRDDLVRAGHSISPSFLAHQLAQSRANLRLHTIDLYYLHNPEEQLLGVDRATFRLRLRTAFTRLEERAERGEIGGYGCATWLGLRVGPEHRQHLTLAELVTVAREIAGATHHFRAVQLPVSLAMPAAARLPTQALGRHLVPLLEAADALGVAVMASAPLMQGRLTDGLPMEMRALLPGCSTDAQRALRFAASLPAVRTVLAGMRRREHVAENVGAWRC